MPKTSKSVVTSVSDREAVLAAVSKDGLELMRASKELRSDREVVLAAVSNGGHGLFYVPKTLRADREVVLAAVSNLGSALGAASKKLRNDREIVLAAVREDGWSGLDCASKELKNDREVMKEELKRLSGVEKRAEELEVALAVSPDANIRLKVKHLIAKWHPDKHATAVPLDNETVTRDLVELLE